MTSPFEGKDITSAEQAQSLVKGRTEEEKKFLKEALNTPEEVSHKEKQEKKESVEKLTTPRLQKENHKIDKNMSLEEKLKNGRKKEQAIAYINGKESQITILKKTIAGAKEDAFAWEYLEGVPNNLKGEQLFNWNAMLNLGIDKKLPSYEQMLAIRGDNHKKFLEDNFQKNNESLFPGYWSPRNNKFYNLGKTFSNLGKYAICWLSAGNALGIDGDTVYHGSGNPRFGFSVRLLED